MTAAINRIIIPRSKESKPCVCGSCNCGCHHCPGIIEPLPFQGVTTYRVQYTPKEAEHQRPYVPSKIPVVTPATSSHFTTTNQNFFYRPSSAYGGDGSDIRKTTLIIPTPSIQTAGGPLSAVTTQRHDFPAYQVSRRVSSAPPRRAMEPAPSFGVYETTNNAMQGPVAAAMRNGSTYRPMPTVQQVTLVRSGAPLDGSTTYKEYFPPKKSVYERLWRARQQLPKNMSPAAMLDDRDFKTMTATQFAAPAVVRPVCPAAPFSKRPASSDGHITMKL